jgi:hypothetical protein
LEIMLSIHICVCTPGIENFALTRSQDTMQSTPFIQVG